VGRIIQLPTAPAVGPPPPAVSGAPPGRFETPSPAVASVAATESALQQDAGALGYLYARVEALTAVATAQQVTIDQLRDEIARVALVTDGMDARLRVPLITAKRMEASSQALEQLTNSLTKDAAATLAKPVLEAVNSTIDDLVTIITTAAKGGL
jgi:uncharacterized coiled-coil protein SlyX